MKIFRGCVLVVLVWLAGASFAEARQCSFTLTPTTFAVGSTASQRTLSIITGTQCSWTATSAVSWITVSNGVAGTGIGSVTFTIEQNPAAAPRTGILTVAGQAVSVTQAAGTCAYTVTPTSFTVDPIAGTRTVSIVAGTQCGWSSTPSATWITVTGGATGSGNGAVTFEVEANPSTSPRTAALTIGGQAVAITQGGSGGGQVPPPPSNLHIVR